MDGVCLEVLGLSLLNLYRGMDSRDSMIGVGVSLALILYYAWHVVSLF